jgi:hypothetical protein
MNRRRMDGRNSGPSVTDSTPPYPPCWKATTFGSIPLDRPQVPASRSITTAASSVPPTCSRAPRLSHASGGGRRLRRHRALRVCLRRSVGASQRSKPVPHEDSRSDSIRRRQKGGLVEQPPAWQRSSCNRTMARTCLTPERRHRSNGRPVDCAARFLRERACCHRDHLTQRHPDGR